MLELASKDFKAAIVTALNDIKENIFLMNENIRNHKRGKTAYKKVLNGNSYIENYNFWKKKSLYGLNTLMNTIKEKVNECENRLTEIIYTDEQKWTEPQ